MYSGVVVSPWLVLVPALPATSCGCKLSSGQFLCCGGELRFSSGSTRLSNTVTCLATGCDSKTRPQGLSER